MSDSQISPTDIGWAAGFLEGEGTFQFPNTPSINATQAQMEPLERLVSLFGGTIYKLRKQEPHHKEKQRWSVCGKNAVQVAFTIYVLMSEERKNQIALMIHKWKGMKGHRRTICQRGHELNGTNIASYHHATMGIRRECRICRDKRRRVSYGRTRLSA